MKLQIFSIFDNGIKAFSTPFFLLHENEALRGWTQVCNDKSTKMNEYPMDYTLFHIGSFDSETGVITPLLTPSRLSSAHEVIKN